ncbi:putative deoxyribonuclease YjjV [Thiorhodovibrio winogradskyi]|uniref:Deoxyribonuclease YjjV n=1 Tax=Thiorhodovibrio winogradskyi TaxID=77007 RepID=A0ABZ0SF61_9GAMM|nr:TatD family hydrolase [Thiorhodovibrio winogradskyi]
MLDTHCHLDFSAFDQDRTEVLARARASGVLAILIPGVISATWQGVLDLCQRSHGSCFPALGLHPLFITAHQPADIDRLRERLRQQPPIAIGEIGLDFADRDCDRDTQRWYFTRQLILAREFNLPVLLHVRKAHDEVIQVLRTAQLRGGIAHAFNGSLQQAQAYLALGFKLGFGGMLTFGRSRKLRHLARELPLEALVLETDAPDMTVASHQGQRNSPEYLPEVLAALAGVRTESLDELAKATTANAISVLQLDRSLASLL